MKNNNGFSLSIGALVGATLVMLAMVLGSILPAKADSYKITARAVRMAESLT